MASPSGDLPRFPFDNVLNFVPQGHEKALKHAFYNAAAMAFLLFGAAAAGATYFVLGPFLRPLLWAVLCGSVLHPFKHSLTCIVRSWLQNLKSSGTPLTVGLAVFPIGIVDRAAESVGGLVVTYAKALISVTVSLILAVLACTFTPNWILHIMCFCKNLTFFTLNALLCIFDSFWVWTLIVGYLLVVAFYWNASSCRLLRQLAFPLWAILLLHLVAIIGSFRIPVCIFLFILMGIGFCKEVKDVNEQELEEHGEEENQSVYHTAWALLSGSHESSSSHSLISSEHSEKETVSESDLKKKPRKETSSDSDTSLKAAKTPSASTTPRPSKGSLKYKDIKVSNGSNMYLWSLVWACGIVQFYYHLWLLPLFAFPLWYFIIKRAGQSFGVWAFVQQKFLHVRDVVVRNLDERKDALFPAPVRGVAKMVVVGDQKVLHTLDSALDTFVSLSTIIIVIFCTLFAVIFLAVQIHAESMHMVQVTSNLINRTVVNNPELQALLPEGLGEMVDSALDNAYLYGREWSANMVKSFIGEQDEAKALLIEKQVLELWDRVYHAWISSNENIHSQSIGPSWNSLLDGLTAPGLFNLGKITDFVKDNIGTFMSVVTHGNTLKLLKNTMRAELLWELANVLESVWSVLKGNLSLAISALTATLSLLFGGGTALLNFFISFVVFMTALFYLLASSGEQYKLVELIGKMTPAGSGSRFGVAAEEAINGVFAASFKMAFFYGMWTWLIHTLFGVKIVYIPSALAAMFGAVPFLGTYWAVFPAVLELWLVQESGVQAILMMACQLLPMSFVDTEIYSEIKGGGHPYLTGLAIAGGIFCLGMEGALIGPILLCCLFVAINMCSSMMQESPVNEPSKRSSRPYLYKRVTSVL